MTTRHALRPRSGIGTELTSLNCYALLGLPVHAVTMDEALLRVRAAVRERKRLFLTTPNLNFAMACARDEAFRDSVIDSDLVVADGMPLVWVAKCLGLPVRERVAGSTLFECLQAGAAPAINACGQAQPPIKVYFFGGQSGAAAAAADRLNQNPAPSAAMRCVGFHFPGFGAVQDMGDAALIDAINASGADLLVVALGAQKGQAWIQSHRARLNVPVISHLGAVLNFTAGHVRRAPAWMQRSGLEWLWRIREEPQLWRRYGRDALQLLCWALRCLWPALWHQWRHAALYLQPASAEFRLLSDETGQMLHLSGRCNRLALPQWHAWRAVTPDTDEPLHLDLSQAESVDSAFLGALLGLLHARRARGLDVQIAAVSPLVRRQLGWYGLGYWVRHA